jgi:hypothetical protein
MRESLGCNVDGFVITERPLHKRVSVGRFVGPDAARAYVEAHFDCE